MKPFVGAPTSPGTGCAYAPDIDQPACDAPATLHVIGYAPGWGWVCLPTCAHHRDLAEAGCTRVTDVHPAHGCSGEHYAPLGGEQP
ncbi:hypothetical protein [Micromonospora echinospora]|uniref:hypothetical protein n=1 Tax=Micromonospora echinospora TaxID=1877 RepID=UPI003A8ACC99